MTITAFITPRATHALDAARRLYHHPRHTILHRPNHRRRLTPEERANMRACSPPAAVFTASLGGRPPHW